MYAKSYTLYPFSKRNVAIIRAYAEKFYEAYEIETAKGDYEKAENLFAKYIHVNNLASGGAHGHEDVNCIWLTGKDYGEAKKILAMS